MADPSDSLAASALRKEEAVPTSGLGFRILGFRFWGLGFRA